MLTSKIARKKAPLVDINNLLTTEYGQALCPGLRLHAFKTYMEDEGSITKQKSEDPIPAAQKRSFQPIPQVDESFRSKLTQVNRVCAADSKHKPQSESPPVIEPAEHKSVSSQVLVFYESKVAIDRSVSDLALDPHHDRWPTRARRSGRLVRIQGLRTRMLQVECCRKDFGPRS